MTIETEPIQERLRPRILQTEETGRLDLDVRADPELSPPILPTGPSISSISIAATGLAILATAWVGVDLANFVGGAFTHSTTLGVVAAVAVAAGCGGIGYWLAAELRGLMRLRSAERLRSMIPAAVSSELKREIDAAAMIVARDPLLSEAVGRFRAVLEPHHTGRDALELFSRFVLVPADRLAEAAIRRASMQAFAINAISPTAMLDTLLF